MIPRFLSIFSTNENEKNKPAVSRSEPIRADLVQADQKEWDKQSILAEQEIMSMMKKGRSLVEIYEFAGMRRREIAKSLGHQPAEHFGQIRVPEEFPHYSDYRPEKIAGSKADPKLFETMVEILRAQNENFNVTHFTEEDAYSGLARFFRPVYQYQSNPKNATDVTVEIYSTNELNKPGTKPDAIRVKWGDMNPKIFRDKLLETNPQLVKVLKEADPEKALFELGLLAYDLLKPHPYKRGSAAITGWVIRSAGKMKGFEIGNMRICGLPYDIYAQIQLNREKFAADFVKSLNEDYRLIKQSQVDKKNTM